jgi:hypothetical protein
VREALNTGVAGAVGGGVPKVGASATARGARKGSADPSKAPYAVVSTVIARDRRGGATDSPSEITIRPGSSGRTSEVLPRNVRVQTPRSVSIHSASPASSSDSGTRPRRSTTASGRGRTSVVISRGCSGCRFSSTMRGSGARASVCWSGGAALK